MEYENIRQAKFISRPNRFLSYIEIDGRVERCHVKNTGRCKEILVPGTTVYVRESGNSNRKTKYDLISAYKGDRLINIDSQVPNRVFYEWVTGGNLFDDITLIKPECKYKNSRFDFYIETPSRKAFIEVKGVTLEIDGVAMFPDAPTERGVRHLTELCQSVREGYEAYLVFIIQMKSVLYFAPNIKTHKAFRDALKMAADKGVKVLAFDCEVTETSILAGNFVGVKI